MNKEEKKAIKMLNEMRTWDNYCYLNKEVVENIETVLNLIEKQQAEIEYWREQAQGYSDLSKQIKEDYEQRLEDYYNEG